MEFLSYLIGGLGLGSVYAIIAIVIQWFTALPRC